MTTKGFAAGLPAVECAGESVALHNYYEPRKFLRRMQAGRLVDVFDQRCMLVSEDFIVGFQFALEEEVGDAAADIMYRCGYEWGRRDIARFAARFPEEFGKSRPRRASSSCSRRGGGRCRSPAGARGGYDLTHRKEGLIFVDLYDSAVARSVGNIGKVVCHYYAGMFAAVFSAPGGRELSSIEIQCYSMGEGFCKFLIGSSKRINAAQFWVAEGARASEVIARL
jgi:predicted hydrocarbon binding protein